MSALQETNPVPASRPNSMVSHPERQGEPPRSGDAERREASLNFEEHAAKPLLRAAGIDTPRGVLAHDAGEAAQAAKQLGPCVVKAQVATDKRGKAGGIRLAADPEAARAAANAILGMRIGEHRVE